MRRGRASRELSVVEAKAHFSDCLRSAETGRAIVITRNGKPVAGLVPAEDIKRLDRLRAAGAEAGLASLAGGWRGSEQLVRALARFRRSRRRRPAQLD